VSGQGIRYGAPAEQKSALRALGFTDAAVAFIGPGEADKILGLEEYRSGGEWMTADEAAKFVGVSSYVTLNKWARRGIILPKHQLNGRRAFYNSAELAAWFKQNRKAIVGNRSFKSEMENLCQALYEIVAGQRPMTVRQVYYQAVVRQMIAKTNAGYVKMQRLIRNMRMVDYEDDLPEGTISMPLEWIIDNSRPVYEWATWSDAQARLRHAAKTYARDPWVKKDEQVYVWVEKDALAGSIASVTQHYNVPVLVARGNNSISFIHRFAERIEELDKPVVIYYFRDLDPTGICAPAALRETLEHMAPGSDIEIIEEAITLEQIEEHGLEGTAQPTKNMDDENNAHYPAFAAIYGEGAPSYELDALPAPVLRQLVNDCISRHIDEEELEENKRLEDEDRDVILGGALGLDDYAWA
jgi:hypothetical protein